jgi:hypothetical protein
MMQTIHLPEPLVEFMLMHQHLMPALDIYCRKHYGVKEPRDILVEFYTMQGYGPQIEAILRMCGV